MSSTCSFLALSVTHIAIHAHFFPRVTHVHCLLNRTHNWNFRCRHSSARASGTMTRLARVSGHVPGRMPFKLLLKTRIVLNHHDQIRKLHLGQVTASFRSSDAADLIKICPAYIFALKRLAAVSKRPGCDGSSTRGMSKTGDTESRPEARAASTRSASIMAQMDCGPTVSMTSTRHTISLGKDEENDPDHASYNRTKTVLSTRIGVSQITSHVQKNRYAKTGPA